MITKEQYEEAKVQKKASEDIINQYHKEDAERFRKRLEENPIFTDDELIYSAQTLCPCGHGLAYPKGCPMNFYWDCSAILKGIADKTVKHTDKLSFMMYDVKGESERRGTTRGMFIPQRKD